MSKILFLMMCAAVATLAVGLPATSLAQCTKDTDCKGNRICVEGACVDASSTTGEVSDLQNMALMADLNKYKFYREVSVSFAAVGLGMGAGLLTFGLISYHHVEGPLYENKTSLASMIILSSTMFIVGIVGTALEPFYKKKTENIETELGLQAELQPTRFPGLDTDEPPPPPAIAYSLQLSWPW